MLGRHKTRIVRPEFGELSFFAESHFESATKDSSEDNMELFRNTLKAADEHFYTRFREGEDILRIVRDRSRFMDRILYYAWSQFEWNDDIALVAVGGYGRGELHPYSDIDLLFLTRKSSHEKYRKSITGFTTFLWDLQLKVGHSVRSPKQCAGLAKSDVTIMTTMLESRTIVGDEMLRTQMEELTAPEKIWPPREFYLAKYGEQQERYGRHGMVEYDLEPNVKESPGGLRDIQNIQWVAKRLYKVSSLEALAHRGLYTEQEYNSLGSAQAFLSSVRFGLHMLTGRAHDQLQFEHQRKLAELFNYEDSPKRLAVEKFMQDYYRTVTIVREINDVLMQILDEETAGNSNPSITPINARFQLRGSYIETTSTEVFRNEPSAIMEIFTIMARDKKISGVRASTIRQLREACSSIDSDFRATLKNKELFVELLGMPENLIEPLQRMSRYSVLGRYLPEFEAITGLTQHDLFHIYPVDVHTLNVVKNICNFGDEESRDKSPISHHIFNNIRKPELLVIAGLYHDIAKGRGGDHSELGAEDVVEFMERHGYSEREQKLLAWLVENHLLLSRVAQREDISDPEVISRFAAHVGDEYHLNMLYALTVADINATNPTLWNNWRASLMRQLYTETRRALRRGLENLEERAEVMDENRSSALDILKKKSVDSSVANELWQGVDEDYFVKESPEDIAWQTELALRSRRENSPAVVIRPYILNRRERATQVLVSMRHSNSIFAAIATAIDHNNLNIQDARIYRFGDLTLSIFFILDEHAVSPGKDSSRIERLEKSIRSELKVINEYHEVIGQRTNRRLKQFPLQTRASISDRGNTSILEVITADRPGLLAAIGQLFVKYDIRLLNARITTLGERVEDLFTITDANDNPITDPELKDQLISAICETIDQKVEAAVGA
jgi:[protein-PII] uridylyltransferase